MTGPLYPILLCHSLQRFQFGDPEAGGGSPRTHLNSCFPAIKHSDGHETVNLILIVLATMALKLSLENLYLGDTCA